MFFRSWGNLCSFFMKATPRVCIQHHTRICKCCRNAPVKDVLCCNGAYLSAADDTLSNSLSGCVSPRLHILQGNNLVVTQHLLQKTSRAENTGLHAVSNTNFSCSHSVFSYRSVMNTCLHHSAAAVLTMMACKSETERVIMRIGVIRCEGGGGRGDNQTGSMHTGCQRALACCRHCG